ncbi:MAG TPA: thiamine phosphate synthase [Allosphingosinicella sp.]|jgi:thiamine-phosphate pyrophosphorylase
MHRRQPLPRLWLMTDERQGDALCSALERLPRGSGVVFRHYGLPTPERRRLFGQVRAVARRRRLVLLLAGTPRLAAAWGADGSHGRGSHAPLRGQVRTAPVHDVRDMIAAARAGADLLFVSPAFGTRSHPGAAPLGRVRFGLLARQARGPVVALGGMTPSRFRGLAAFRIYGWAAIDAWSAGPA